MLNHQTLGGPESRDDRQLVTLVLVHVAFWVQHQEVKGGVIILLLLPAVQSLMAAASR